jgi:hypothetical protein
LNRATGPNLLADLLSGPKCAGRELAPGNADGARGTGGATPAGDKERAARLARRIGARREGGGVAHRSG